MAIRNISQRIFRTSNVEQNENRINRNNHSNPFGVSFNGRAVSSDIFEAATPNLSKKVASRGKMLISTIVGSINSAGNTIGRRFNSIIETGRNINSSIRDFGQKVSENISSKWELARNYEINTINFKELAQNMKNRISNVGVYQVSKIKSKSTDEIARMFEDELAILALS